MSLVSDEWMLMAPAMALAYLALAAEMLRKENAATHVKGL